VNERIWHAREVKKPIIELLQDVKGERARKRVQMVVFFHTLTTGRPMLEFENLKPLLVFLGCLKLARTH
jgi:hypothetical protein